MHLKKVIMTGAAVALFASSLLNVSAAELSAGNYAESLKKSGKENLIINVEAYKAAYSDLEQAFGDDESAYIEHYLTIGVYEGRTKGVLFDPLAYAAAYGDVRSAFGNNISAIVDHYITYGAAENRTLGTANGYEDLAAAEKSGRPVVAALRNAYLADSYSAGTEASSYGVGAAANSYGVSAAGISNSGIAAGDSNYGTNMAMNNTASSAAAPVVSAPVAGNTDNSQSYHHTTSIYEDLSDPSSLLRVEYYDENNKLSEYSEVTYDDKSTNSYTETVYRYDEEKQEEVATRTNTYVNGELVSSEKH